MPLIRANGLDIHYSVTGTGPPLVLQHGATSSSVDDWAAQVPLLGHRFRVHLVDARGHAGTRWTDPEGITIETLVADLGGFADALGLETFHAGGFSLGAMTALRFATRQTARLRSLVLVGIDEEPEPRASVARALFDPERIEREDPEWAATLERRHGPVQGAGAWKALVGALAHRVGEVQPLGAAEVLTVRVPTLLVCGDRDPFTPVAHAAALYRQLPDARLLIVPDCGHNALVQRPSIVNEALGAFYSMLT